MQVLINSLRGKDRIKSWADREGVTFDKPIFFLMGEKVGTVCTEQVKLYLW